jgi:hypothetical protein
MAQAVQEQTEEEEKDKRKLPKKKETTFHICLAQGTEQPEK